MTKKEYRQLIEYRVDYINKRLGTDYRISYVSQYGGWNMYEVWDDGQAHHRGVLGFDCRKSNAEMLNYVDGIFQLLCHYDVKQK